MVRDFLVTERSHVTHPTAARTTDAALGSPRRRTAPYIFPDDPLLTAVEAAAERRQAISTFWRDVKAGRVPPAIYTSPRSPRWRRSEIRAALEACRAPKRQAP